MGTIWSAVWRLDALMSEIAEKFHNTTTTNTERIEHSLQRLESVLVHLKDKLQVRLRSDRSVGGERQL